MPLPRTTTFPVEQKRDCPFKGEWELPRLSERQELAVIGMKQRGPYERTPAGHWLPSNAGNLSDELRAIYRATNRTILSLVRNCWVQVTQELNGEPVRVTLTFP